MSELEMKTEAEVEDFTDELSDEALDRRGPLSYCDCVTGVHLANRSYRQKLVTA